MSLATRAGDLFYTFRFLKLLVTEFKDTDAFKLGLIDEKGKRIKTKKIQTPEEKSAFTAFHRLVFNLKRLIPAGKLGTYASALYLIKEHLGISEKNLSKILDAAELDPLDMMNEEHKWFLLENLLLSPGIYRVKQEKVLSSTIVEMVRVKDKIRVLENCYPVDTVFGVNIYEGVHLNTNQKIHFSVGEIER